MTEGNRNVLICRRWRALRPSGHATIRWATVARHLAQPDRDLLLHRPAQGPDPNDFVDLVEVEHRLLGFQRRYEQTAQPFDWRYTRSDLDRLLRRLDDKEHLTKAA
jgi:hypothetical protein